jgi:gamma-glutamyltranspeptidase/glutathione hydrolase
VSLTGQGIVVLMALGILERFDLQRLFENDEVEGSHLILEALKLAFADASSYLADPRFFQTPVKRLLSADYLDGRRDLVQKDRAIDNPSAGRIYGDTTYLTVVDRDRNAVSLITSISDVFGSGIIVPGTGVILHNRGADFALDDSHPNRAAPGKRVRHTILPSMMLASNGKLKLSFGCMGGHEIIWREEIPADWMLPHDFLRSFVGSAQAIAIEEGEGSLAGASDPRLDGIAVAW